MNLILAVTFKLMVISLHDAQFDPVFENELKILKLISLGKLITTPVRFNMEMCSAT